MIAGDEVVGADRARIYLGMRAIAARQLVHALAGDVEGSAVAYSDAVRLFGGGRDVTASLLLAAGDAVFRHVLELVATYADRSAVDRLQLELLTMRESRDDEPAHQSFRRTAVEVLRCAVSDDCERAFEAYAAAAGILAAEVGRQTPTLLLAAGDAVFVHLAEVLPSIVDDVDDLTGRLQLEVLVGAYTGVVDG